MTQVFDRPIRGREFFEEVIRDNLDQGRPDRVQPLFEWKVTKRTPGRFQTRVIQNGVHPSLHITYKKSDVKLELNTEATLATIEKFKPNAVVVATGAQRWIPDIPGMEAPHVLHAEDVISGAKTTGERVVIVGGNQIGCETAWLLGEQKKKVTIIGKYAAIGMDINPATMSYLSMKLREFGVNIVTESYPKTVSKDGITIFNKDWKEQKIEADTIVIATGYRSNFEFAESIKKIVSKVFTVGDCLEPASILEAVHRGSKLGRLIEELA